METKMTSPLLISQTQDILEKVNKLDQCLYRLFSNRHVLCPTCNRELKLFPHDIEELLLGEEKYIKIWCTLCMRYFNVRFIIKFDGVKLYGKERETK